MTASASAVPPRVLVIEDEIDLQHAMVRFLNLDGYQAEGVSTLSAAANRLENSEFDVIVLDLGLPDGDGLELLKSRDDLTDKGVVITTARGENAQRLAGVRAGADVYLVKPIQLEELSITIENLMRRLRPRAPASWALHRLSWTLQAPSGESVKLTHSEATLLEQLVRAPGKPVARADLVRALGRNPDLYDPRRLEIMMRRLRKKCDVSLNRPLPVETVHGFGYAFVDLAKVIDMPEFGNSLT